MYCKNDTRTFQCQDSLEALENINYLAVAENQTPIAWSSSLRSCHHAGRIVQALSGHYRSQTENKALLNHELIPSANAIRVEVRMSLNVRVYTTNRHSVIHLTILGVKQKHHIHESCLWKEISVLSYSCLYTSLYRVAGVCIVFKLSHCLQTESLSSNRVIVFKPSHCLQTESLSSNWVIVFKLSQTECRFSSYHSVSKTNICKRKLRLERCFNRIIFQS